MRLPGFLQGRACLRAALLALATMLLLPGVLYSQTLALKKDVAFKPGELLTYKLKYGFITAATATLQVSNGTLDFNGAHTYKLEVDARTSGSFDVFYKIRDHYESYIDKLTLLPYFYRERIRESSYKRDDKARFTQSERKVVATQGTFTSPVAQTFDLVSAYYFARNLDLTGVAPGKAFKIYYFLQDGVSSLTVQYVGRESVKTNLGTIRCLKFSPVIKPGRVFRKDSKLYLWVTDDDNRIPVRAQVEILVGTVTLELMKAEGLKHPL